MLSVPIKRGMGKQDVMDAYHVMLSNLNKE